MNLHGWRERSRDAGEANRFGQSTDWIPGELWSAKRVQSDTEKTRRRRKGAGFWSSLVMVRRGGTVKIRFVRQFVPRQNLNRKAHFAWAVRPRGPRRTRGETGVLGRWGGLKVDSNNTRVKRLIVRVNPKFGRRVIVFPRGQTLPVTKRWRRRGSSIYCITVTFNVATFEGATFICKISLRSLPILATGLYWIPRTAGDTWWTSFTIVWLCERWGPVTRLIWKSPAGDID